MAPHKNYAPLAEQNSSSDNLNWRELYRAAILELDPSKIPSHIVDAEKAIMERARELLDQDGDNNSGEKLALDDAMYFLQALRSTLKFNTSASPYGGENHRVEAA